MASKTQEVQKQSKYMLPEKADELDRLHKQHAVFRYMLQGNFQAPVAGQLEKGITVLDSGCGPGAWTIDVAKEYPNSTFYGVDITASYLPDSTEVPENCHFSLANVAEKIPFPDNYFDYVHQRLLVFGLGADDWDKALREIFRVVKPGGYVEFAEVLPKIICATNNRMSNNPVNIGPLYKILQEKMAQFMDVRKMCAKISTELEERLPQVGFVNQKQIVAKFQINHTDKAGEIYWEDCRHVFQNLQPFVVSTNPEWAENATYEKFLDDCGNECKELKTSSQFYIYYAQKPF